MEISRVRFEKKLRNRTLAENGGNVIGQVYKQHLITGVSTKALTIPEECVQIKVKTW